MKQNKLLNAALLYASKGIYVFPLKPKEKYPITPNGFKNASINETQIKKWWNENPNANIGIATGSGYSNLMVLDIDQGNGKQGLSTFNELNKMYEDFTTLTWRARSGNGGIHYYYKLSKGQDIKNSTGKIGKDIDIRGNGGYIVAPPSIHPNGKAYEWLEFENVNLSNVPSGLLKALNTDKEDKKEKSTETGLIPKGHRDNELFRIAVKAQNSGASEEGIRALVYAENNRCIPPMSHKELEKIIKSALKYENEEIPTAQIQLVSLDNIEEKEPEWLIKGWIPKHTVTTLAGDGGSGKTSLWCHLAACLSSGEQSIIDDPEFFTFKRYPMKIVYFSSEDSTESVLVGKLKANGAMLRNILHVPQDDDNFKLLKFKTKELESVIASTKPDLVIFDPLQGFLDHDTQMSQRNHMREELEHITSLCIKYDTSALIVMHTNKSHNTSGRGRMADSADIWDISRSCLMVGQVQEDDTRYLSQEKNNYGMLNKTVLFSIQEKGKLKLEGYTHKKDKDFQSERADRKRNAPTRDEAIKSIIEYMETTEDGTAPVKELDEYLSVCGFSNHIIRTSKEELKKTGEISINKLKEKKGEWTVKIINH